MRQSDKVGAKVGAKVELELVGGPGDGLVFAFPPYPVIHVPILGPEMAYVSYRAECRLTASGRPAYRYSPDEDC